MRKLEIDAMTAVRKKTELQQASKQIDEIDMNYKREKKLNLIIHTHTHTDHSTDLITN